MTGVLIREKTGRFETERQGGGDVTVEAATSLETPEPPEAGRGRDGSSPRD